MDLFADVDEQDFAIFLCGERHRAFVRHAHTVTLGQDEVVGCRLAADDVEPGASSRQQLVDEVMPRVDQARVNMGILMCVQRPLTPVWRRDDAQNIVALRCSDVHLLAGTIGLPFRRAKGDPEDVRPVGP